MCRNHGIDLRFVEHLLVVRVDLLGAQLLSGLCQGFFLDVTDRVDLRGRMRIERGAESSRRVRLRQRCRS